MKSIRDAIVESNLLSEEDLSLDLDLEDRINSLEEEPLSEEVITEERLVEIPYEDYMTESLVITEEAPKMRKVGSSEYDSNEGRIKRVNHFRKLVNLEDDEPITEALIESKDWAVKNTACTFNRPSARIKAELLNQKYTGLEEYED